MRAESSVELGKDDHCLEVPWLSPDGKLRYFDLRNQPELLLEVGEAHDNRELGEFLASINQPPSFVQSVKCDTWLTNELDTEDEIYGADWKFGSYVDLIFVDPDSQIALPKHEEFARNLTGLLSRAPNLAAAFELVVRRCYYHRGTPPQMDESDDGFCATLYLYGYGDDEDQARKNWAIGLKLLQNALLQLSARYKAAQ